MPWDQANQRHTIRLELVDADGAPVTVTGEDDEEAAIVFLDNVEFEVGRPAGYQARHAARAANRGNSGPLPLKPGGRYEWRLSINDRSDEDWRLAFSVRPEEEIA